MLTVRGQQHSFSTLLWCHNDNDSVSNHQPHGCLLNPLFRRRSKKTSKLHVTGLCVGNSPGPVNSPHKGPVTRKMFRFDDVIMHTKIHLYVYIYVLILWEPCLSSFLCILPPSGAKTSPGTVQTSKLNILYSNSHWSWGFLTHWGRGMHTWFSKLTNTGSDNGLPPDWHQAIIWTNAGILLIGPLGTNLSEFMIGSHTLSFKKMHLKISSTKWHPFGLILNVLITFPHRMISFQMATQKSPATWSGLMPFR